MGRLPLRPVALAAAAVAALACSSCGGGKKFVPVRGRVMVNGKPAAGVSIVFNLVDDPDAKPIQPNAIVAEDGTYELKSYIIQDRQTKDGAPPGKYRVSCVWYPPDLQKYLNAGAALPDRLHGKYADAQKSGLTADVGDGPTEVPPFELTAAEH